MIYWSLNSTSIFIYITEVKFLSVNSLPYKYYKIQTDCPRGSCLIFTLRKNWVGKLIKTNIHIARQTNYVKYGTELKYSSTTSWAQRIHYSDEIINRSRKQGAQDFLTPYAREDQSEVREVGNSVEVVARTSSHRHIEGPITLALPA